MSKKLKSKFSSPPVILLNLIDDEQLFNGIYERACYYGWLTLDVKITGYSISPDTNIIGYLTRRLDVDPLVDQMLNKEIPVIRVEDGPNEEFDGTFPAVIFDFVEAGKLAADHFAERNFKNVGFVGNKPWGGYPYLYNSFQKRALEKGLECHLLQVKSPPLGTSISKIFEFRSKQINKWLENLPKPIGIFTYHDKNAAAIYATAKEAGMEVPEEVAILGCGDIHTTCNFLPVPLSSIDMNGAKKGREAVELLHQLLHGEKPKETIIVIPPKGIVERQSTNLLAVPDPVVARALRFIWDHFTEQISVDDVAMETGVAKSTLIRKFKKNLNHGVNFEVRRKRLEYSCELLRSTQMTVEDIANASGFPSLPYFYTAFTDFNGISPGNYRKTNATN